MTNIITTTHVPHKIIFVAFKCYFEFARGTTMMNLIPNTLQTNYLDQFL